MATAIVLRIQSPEHGTKRVSISLSETAEELHRKVAQEFSLSPNGWTLCSDRNGSRRVERTSRTLNSSKLRNGEMLYLVMSKADGLTTSLPSPSGIPSLPEATLVRRPQAVVVEDEVDQHLEQADGKILRSRNEQLCRHGPSGKCLHCVPLEPFDEEYLKQCDPPIKFLSFHSYLRKLNSGVDKGKFTYLENLSCKIKAGCREHPPWPAGICTKCQPNAVTLGRQKFRHVDYIMIENRFVVDRFLDFWRRSGSQRVGLLIGKYEAHADIPLGIKATVAAIYEPPQRCSKNSIELLDDPNEATMDELCAGLGLRRIGWIFTDLVALDLKTGTVKHCRGHKDSHFLSAEECIMAADFQNKYLNVCRHATEGVFGSKFVTIVVTGDKANQVHFEGYQVSDQCMGLVRDDCFIPTRDAPELGYIRESTNDQYVPDVFYKEKDEYGNEVTRLARPLPVEYLLIDMSVAFPKEMQFTFLASDARKPFPVENRDNIGEVQNLDALAIYMSQFSPADFLAAVSDFHFLYYLAQYDVVPFRGHMSALFEAVRNKDESLAQTWAHCEQWSTMEQLTQSSSAAVSVPRRGSTATESSSSSALQRSHNRVSPPRATSSSASPLPAARSQYVGAGASPLPAIGSTWTCSHCTFINTFDNDACEMCSLPR